MAKEQLDSSFTSLIWAFPLLTKLSIKAQQLRCIMPKEVLTLSSL